MESIRSCVDETRRVELYTTQVMMMRVMMQRFMARGMVLSTEQGEGERKRRERQPHLAERSSNVV
jgi:hypothetical protein